MLKKHFKDLFTEGLGDIFYMKVYNLMLKADGIVGDNLLMKGSDENNEK